MVFSLLNLSDEHFLESVRDEVNVARRLVAARNQKLEDLRKALLEVVRHLIADNLKDMELQASSQRSERILCRTFDVGRQRVEHVLSRGRESLVVGTVAFFCPSVGIATVTTAAHIGFEPDAVAFVVPLLKTLLADNTCRVLFTVFAFPRHIAVLKRLCTNSHSCTLRR